MSLWLAHDPLVLASKSSARRMVLQGAAIPLEIVPADIDERAAEQGIDDPAVAARVLSEAKARAVSRMMPGRFVLGADQTLALGPRRFSKPKTREAAATQLRALSGATHHLHSGFALARDDAIVTSHVESAAMTMRDLSDAVIARYLDAVGDAALTSVGAYQIEGAGIHLFARVEGDHTTILGMPLLPLLVVLRTQGLAP